jgi:hypothetical protein
MTTTLKQLEAERAEVIEAIRNHPDVSYFGPQEDPDHAWVLVTRLRGPDPDTAVIPEDVKDLHALFFELSAEIGERVTVAIQ